MSKLIDALKAIAAGEDVTPVTCVTHAEVTRKPAWIKAVTPVTRVTPPINDGGEKLSRFAAKGIPPEHVERIIKMIDGRHPWDGDMRSCAECAALVGSFCLKGLQPVGQLDHPALCLHRCRGFAPDLAVSEGERHE